MGRDYPKVEVVIKGSLSLNPPEFAYLLTNHWAKRVIRNLLRSPVIIFPRYLIIYEKNNS